jgi:hypothetical protein
MKNRRKYMRLEKNLQNLRINEDRIRHLKDLIEKRKSDPNQYNFIHRCLQLFPDNLWPETEMADKIEELSLLYIGQLEEENEKLRKKIGPSKKFFDEFKRIEFEVTKIKDRIKKSRDILRKGSDSSAVDIFIALRENGVEKSAMEQIRVILQNSIETNKDLIEQKYKELENL